MRTWIEDLAEHQRRITEMEVSLVYLVRQARLAGASWEAIGNALGVSRQAAWDRWASQLAAMDAAAAPEGRDVE